MHKAPCRIPPQSLITNIVIPSLKRPIVSAKYLIQHGSRPTSLQRPSAEQGGDCQWLSLDLEPLASHWPAWAATEMPLQGAAPAPQVPAWRRKVGSSPNAVLDSNGLPIHSCSSSSSLTPVGIKTIGGAAFSPRQTRCHNPSASSRASRYFILLCSCCCP